MQSQLPSGPSSLVAPRSRDIIDGNEAIGGLSGDEESPPSAADAYEQESSMGDESEGGDEEEGGAGATVLGFTDAASAAASIAASTEHPHPNVQSAPPPAVGASAATAAAASATRRKRHKHRHHPSRAAGAAAAVAAPLSSPDGCCVRWLGPGSAVLWLFTLCQLMIFYDRGMVAGFLPSIQEDLGGMSDTQMGLLGSGFIFGYMLACPLFAFFSKSYSAYKLMSIGLFLWVNAVLLCGLTDNFITLLGARILTGVGEASFAGLAPTCIDDVAPLKHRTIWLSFFFSGIPIGSALGYISGGWFAAAEGLGWHYGFLTEALCMAPIVVIVFFWPNHMEISKEIEEQEALQAQAHEDALAQRALRRNRGGWAQHQQQQQQQTQRLQAEPPRDSAFYEQAGTAGDAESGGAGGAGGGVAGAHASSNEEDGGDEVALMLPLPAPARLLSSAPNISRSLSTPALRRLEHSAHGSFNNLLGSGVAAGAPEDATDVLVAAAATSAEPPVAQVDQETAAVTSNASAASAGLSVIPSSPSAARVSTVMRGARTPVLSHGTTSRTSGEQPSYIVPDPQNPYHAPGRHYREATYAVATPGGPAWHRASGGGADHRSGARSTRGSGGLGSGGWGQMAIDPLASLPSPGSFNPHYASMQLRASYGEGGEDLRTEELFVADIGALLTDGVYIVVVLGYAALAFVIGALSFWAPVDFSKTLHISISRSTQIIGLITFSCGLGGTFFGGWCLDYRGGCRGIFAVISALELCCLFVTLSIGFALGAVLATDLTTSMVCLALADFFLFGTGAPVNAALLSVAPKNMRSLAMAMSILLMHALGDLPSPFLMGYITDQVNSIQLALVILCLWLLWTVFFWAIGVHLARRRAEAFKVQLRKDMSRPAHERSALLARRGSTGQFYSGGNVPISANAAAIAYAHSNHVAGGRQNRYRVPTEVQPHHSSGPSTPHSSGSQSGRYDSNRSRSAAHTPQQHRRSVYQGQASPGLREASPSGTLYDAASPPQTIVTLPIYDRAGQVVGYTEAPPAGEQKQYATFQLPEGTSLEQQAAPNNHSRQRASSDLHRHQPPSF